MQKQGSTLFKVASILLLIWGAIALIVNLIQLIQYSGLLALVGGGLVFAFILLIASTAVMVIGGIMGLAGGKNPAKAKTFMIVGVIALALLLIGTIMILASIGGGGVNWIFTFIGVILTVIYIVGSLQLKNLPVNPPTNNYGGPYNNPYNNQ